MSPFIFEKVIERVLSHPLGGGAMLRADIAAIKTGIEPSPETLIDQPPLGREHVWSSSTALKINDFIPQHD